MKFHVLPRNENLDENPDDRKIAGLRLCLQSLEEEARELGLSVVVLLLRAARESLLLSD